MSGLHNTKIDWASTTWNPVTGCYHGCEYCYANRFIKRFCPHGTERPESEADVGYADGFRPIYSIQTPTRLVDEAGDYIRSTPYPRGFAPTFHPYTLDFPEKRKTPSRIFVSSMGDLFGSWVPDEWITAVFDACQRAPQHTYLFLTKNPQRYAKLSFEGKLPAAKNFWYGVTATDHEKAEHAFRYLPASWRGYNYFLSAEPLLGPINLPALEQYPKWVIIGGMTGPGSKKQQPKGDWITNLTAAASARNIPVFMKENLRVSWGDQLAQEYPAGMIEEDDR